MFGASSANFGSPSTSETQGRPSTFGFGGSDTGSRASPNPFGSTPSTSAETRIGVFGGGGFGSGSYNAPPFGSGSYNAPPDLVDLSAHPLLSNTEKKSPEKKPSAKRQKRSVEDDLICSITLELPFDPVTAEDGRLYERSAIETYIENNMGNLKSPITSERMGARLFPATQQKNIIETLIENETISGDLAAKWLEKANRKKQTEELLKKAENGDAEAMESIGFQYKYGSNADDFIKQDFRKAYHCLQLAHEAGSSIYATEHFAHLLVSGNGGTQDKTKGMMLLGLAAGKGSDWAAYMLGQILATGAHGVQVDLDEARAFLEMALSDNCIYKSMDDTTKTKAQAKLDEIGADD